MRKQEIVRRLLIRQSNTCYYCNRHISYAGNCHPYSRATFDHIVLKSDGGQVSLENGVAACHGCNTLRSNTNWIVWLRISKRPEYADSLIRLEQYHDEKMEAKESLKKLRQKISIHARLHKEAVEALKLRQNQVKSKPNIRKQLRQQMVNA